MDVVGAHQLGRAGGFRVLGSLELYGVIDSEVVSGDLGQPREGQEEGVDRGILIEQKETQVPDPQISHQRLEHRYRRLGAEA